MTLAGYAGLLARKQHLATGGGFAPVHGLSNHLFDFQSAVTEWALEQGRAALFLDCGMGKTLIELEWAYQVYAHTGRPVLITTPLAVGFQFVAEAARFGYDAEQSRDGTVAAPITITNYEQLHKFNADNFGALVCDESSILKNYAGATKAAVTEFMRQLPFRLLASATPAPNDWVELGTSSEALGHLGYQDMLDRFFTNKVGQKSSRGGQMFRWGMEDVGWRLKGHAEHDFWRWVASWARAARKPSDLGYPDKNFILPELLTREHIVTPTEPREGALFDWDTQGLQEEREENRRTITQRCELAAQALADADSGVAWCHLNDESALLAKLVEGSVEITGSMSPDEKEEILTAFLAGEVRVIVTKPKIGAWGLNWQFSHRMTYFPSHSYEQWYQAVRRMWRYGQGQPVEVDVIMSQGNERVYRNLRRKAAAAEQMFDLLTNYMNDALRMEIDLDHNLLMEAPPWILAT